MAIELIPNFRQSLASTFERGVASKDILYQSSEVTIIEDDDIRVCEPALWKGNTSYSV